VDAFGVVKADKTKSISVSFPAVVESINVKEGQRVKKGDVLVTLNMIEFQEQIKQKELDLNLENKLLSLKQSSSLKGSDPDLNKLVNDLANAKELYNKQLKELSTKQVLFESGSISKQELIDFQKSVDTQKKAIDDATFSLDSYKQKDSFKLNKQTDIESGRGKINTLTSELKIMKEKLQRSFVKDNTIISDVNDGLVRNIKPTPGYIVQGNDMLMDIIDLSSMVILADVDESFIKDVKLGAKATVIPLADKSKSYTGKVSRITDMAIVKNGQTFIQVEIQIDNNDGFLQLDYNTDIKIAKE
jgi:multidrug resistance efflux pump